MVEFWTGMGITAPAAIAERARRVEADGWDGFKVYDTQCIYGETFVMATTAALATKDLKLSFAASNPVTRHPAVAAAGIASLQAIVGPRVYYGIGRGDSALAHVGGAPASVAMFERYVTAVRRYLHGEPVPFDLISDWCLSADVTTIQLGHAPEASRLGWRDPSAPPVPIEIYATGPKVIALAGRLADRVALGLGGDPDRVRWAIDIARTARAEAGGDPADLSFSAVIPMGIDDDIDRARASVASMVSSSARLAVMSGKVVGPATAEQRAVWQALGERYDMNKHGRTSDHNAVLTDAFIDRFAIVGSPEACVDRILELAELGINAFLMGSWREDGGSESENPAYRALTEKVMPLARAQLRSR